MIFKFVDRYSKNIGVDQMKNNSVKLCIECKDKTARYWGSHFCEKCFRKILSEKLKEDVNNRGGSNSSEKLFS